METLLDVHKKMWIDSLPHLAPSSRRTYFLCTLAEWASRDNKRVDDTIRLKKLKKTFETACASYVPPQRAEIFPLKDIPTLFSPLMVPIAQMACLVAGRLGNLTGFETVQYQLEEEGWVTWRFVWKKHKTLNWTGPRKVSVRFLKAEFPEAVKKIVDCGVGIKCISETERDMLEKEMKNQGMRNHALRRSGINFWNTKGLAIVDIQLISLHTNIETLRMYLD